MPFKVRNLNHSPQWYRERFNSEEGSAPLRAMLKRDMAFVGGDWDSGMTYLERIETYSESWEEIMSGKGGNASPSDLQEVLIREMGKGALKKQEFTQKPFAQIEKIMEKNGITGEQIREFLKWKASRSNAKKAREKKNKKENKMALEAFNRLSVVEKAKFRESGGIIENPKWDF